MNINEEAVTGRGKNTNVLKLQLDQSLVDAVPSLPGITHAPSSSCWWRPWTPTTSQPCYSSTPSISAICCVQRKEIGGWLGRMAFLIVTTPFRPGGGGQVIYCLRLSSVLLCWGQYNNRTSEYTTANLARSHGECDLFVCHVVPHPEAQKGPTRLTMQPEVTVNVCEEDTDQWVDLIHMHMAADHVV